MTEVVYRLYETVDELTTVIENARSVPMSGSCLVPRDHLLDLLDDLRESLPEDVQAAGAIVEQRTEILSQAQAEAERLVAEGRRHREALLADAQAQQAEILATARAEHERLITETEVYRGAVSRADELGAQTASDVARMRAEVDQYVDSRLADFGGTLEHMLVSVEKARTALREP
jgi:regulator of protease activity HflC (stomatin/prohibitin superfamily)